MMDKKAQGMSMNVIIIAVIALVVLIVLVLIFTGKVRFFGSTASETTSQFTGARCEVPGTNNVCDISEDECRRRGGSYNDRTEYEGCYSCCLM